MNKLRAALIVMVVFAVALQLAAGLVRPVLPGLIGLALVLFLATFLFRGRPPW